MKRVILLAVFSTACSGLAAMAPSASPVTPATTRIANFETGNMSQLQYAVDVQAVPAARYTGSYGMDARSAGTPSWAAWGSGWLAQNHRYWSFAAFVKVVSWTSGQAVDLFTVQNATKAHNFDLFVDKYNHKFRWDLYQANTAYSSNVVQLGKWYLVQAYGDYGSSTYTASVRINGVTQPAISSTNQTTSTTSEFMMGTASSSKTNEKYYDDVKVEVGDVPLSYITPSS
jgi:hypothetical protein